MLYTALAWLASAGVGLVSTPPVAADGCVDCHRSATPRLAAVLDRDIHRIKAVACTACHGGDAAATTKEGGHAAAKGYRGAIPTAEFAALCTSCHGDADRMKPAAADPQMLSEWQQSRHGQLQQAGDRRGAHCVSCHGAHGILPATDPRSTIHRRNVPATCGACHGDAEVMKGSAHGNRAVQDYLDGVHGQVLTGRRAGSADLVPTCVDCHGAHGPRPPEARSVPAVCGTCHFEIHRFMMLGPHRNALKHTGSPSCATCHGNHKNAVPHGERMAEVCLPCHKTTDDAGQAMARQIIAALDKTTRVAADVRALVEHDGTRLATGSQQLLALQQERVEARRADLKKTIHLMDAAVLTSAVGEIAALGTAAEAIARSDPYASHGFSPTVVALVLGAVVLVIAGLTLALAYALRRLRRPAAAAANVNPIGREE